MKKIIFYLMLVSFISCVSNNENPVGPTSHNKSETLLKSVQTSEFNEFTQLNLQLLREKKDYLEDMLVSNAHLTLEEAKQVKFTGYPVYIVDAEKLEELQDEDEIIPEECLKLSNSHYVFWGYLDGKFCYRVETNFDMKDLDDSPLIKCIHERSLPGYKKSVDEILKTADNKDIFYIKIPGLSSIAYYENGELKFKQPFGASGGRATLAHKLATIKKVGNYDVY